MKRTPLYRKTPPKANAKRKPKRKKKSDLQKRIDKKDSSYWNRKCKEAVAEYMHRQACFICGRREPEVELVCGHHNIFKSMSRYHRWEVMNLVPMCKDHHLYDDMVSPHRKDLPLAVVAYTEVLKAKLPKHYEWWIESDIERRHQRLTAGPKQRPDWRGQYEMWQDLIKNLDDWID